MASNPGLTTLCDRTERFRHFDFIYGAVTAIFAIALLVAASLKVLSLRDVSSQSRGNFSVILSESEIAIEWGLGLVLLSGFARLWARRVATALLMVFLGVAGWHLANGRKTCGCFGNLEVSPLWTFLFDLVILTAVLIFRYLATHMPRGVIPMGRPSVRRVFFAVAVAFFIPALSLAIQPSGHTSGTDNILFLDSVLAPGKPFALLPYLSVADRTDLSHGSRTVILFNHECEHCREYLASFAGLSPQERTSIVGIDIVPGGTSALPFRQIFVVANTTITGIMPARVTIRDGTVTAVQHP